ncbi:MAG: hypothetical protein U0269_00160 [Polyangiales bacterium]
MSPFERAAVVAIALLCARCSTSPRARFESEVAPVLARRCGTTRCHGSTDAVRSPREFVFRLDDRGQIAPDAMEDAYRSAKRFIDTAEIPELSSLLRKPLPSDFGGVSHGGGVAFYRRDDSAFESVRAWIAVEHGGGEDGDRATLSEGERFFASEVQPRLAQALCMTGACHGAASGVPLQFVAAMDGVFGVAATKANYREALVHLALGGHGELSRLARKPLHRSSDALPHRGGNGLSAGPSAAYSALPRAIASWATLERQLRVGRADDGFTAIAFVGGPIAAARINDHRSFAPGSDVYILAPPNERGSVRNVTATLHEQPADIRDPCVDDRGERLAFSMRTRADGPRELWEVSLATGRSVQRTRGVLLANGEWSVDRWPAYGPDGRLWFVSTRAAMLAEHADGLDTDLYVIERDESITRRSFTPSPELATTFFRQGRETSGSVAFTALRRLGRGFKGVVYRFPNDLHSEYHQHVGITLGDDVTWHMRETAEGNYVGLALDRDAQWSAGALLYVDRNLGIALPTHAIADASLPAYREPVTYLGPFGSTDDAIVDPYSTREGNRTIESDGAWRDPHPTPDGRLLAAWADGPVRLLDASSAPDFGLYMVELDRDRETLALSVRAKTRLVDLPGLSETQPVAICVSVPGQFVAEAPRGERGVLAYGGATMIEQILRQVGPHGARSARDDIRAVRVLQWIARAQDEAWPTEESLARPQRRSGAGPHLPARVLAEVPLESDGTFFASIPAGTAFRLQYLDDRGMAVGVQHNRWFDIQGGQLLRQGTSTHTYDARCAVCHGARSGASADAFAPVDVTARASRSLARFEGDDPDRPRAAIALDQPLDAEWQSTVAPALRRSCASARCHDEITHAGALVLDPVRTARYDRAYESLMALGQGSRSGYRYVDVDGASARGSYLVEHILGEELDAPRSLVIHAPHRGEPPLDDASLRALLRWIEAGASFSTEVR